MRHFFFTSRNSIAFVRALAFKIRWKGLKNKNDFYHVQLFIHNECIIFFRCECTLYACACACACARARATMTFKLEHVTDPSNTSNKRSEKETEMPL